ncbi:MAG: hypothetical protein QXI58_04385 [Candidatus Micrarchaeia archaeon]
MPTVTTDKKEYTVGEKIKFTAEGLVAGRKYIAGVGGPELGYIIGSEYTADSTGKITGEFFIGQNIVEVGVSKIDRFAVVDKTNNTTVAYTAIKITGGFNLDEMMKSMMDIMLPMMSLMMFMNMMMSLLSSMGRMFAGGF